MAAHGLSDPTVLLTGFDAFGGAAVNPSWLAAQALHGRQIAGHRVVSARLPTVFGTSLQELHGLLNLHAPALVLCLGLASGRGAMSIERVAININDTSLADNQGARPVDTPVVPDGPAAYFSSLPVKALLQALQRHGLTAELSQTAGPSSAPTCSTA
jgi:pyroglutamyl-peptidase